MALIEKQKYPQGIPAQSTKCTSFMPLTLACCTEEVTLKHFPCLSHKLFHVCFTPFTTAQKHQVKDLREIFFTSHERKFSEMKLSRILFDLQFLFTQLDHFML